MFKQVLEQMEPVDMEILSITDEGLGHTSHLIGLGDRTALVIDPTRFPDRQRRLAEERGWQIAWAADTRSHADYVSGSPALAVDGAVFLAPARAGLEHPHRGVEAGEDLEIADGVVLRANATPGHTPDRAELVRQCLNVGHERLLGEVDGGIDAWTASGHPTASIPLIEPDNITETVLDVRQDGEWQTGHLPGAQHVELGAVPDMPLPDGQVTVMCGHGERAMTAASLLAARGHPQLAVLDGGPDDWPRTSGQPLTLGR